MTKEYAKHKVKVWLAEKSVPSTDPKDSSNHNGITLTLCVPTGEFYPEWEIKHTEECDSLKYGQECALDWMLNYETGEMPTEPGNYLVWVVDDSGYVNNWSHCGWEAEFYIDFERLPDE